MSLWSRFTLTRMLRVSVLLSSKTCSFFQVDYFLRDNLLMTVSGKPLKEDRSRPLRWVFAGTTKVAFG